MKRWWTSAAIALTMWACASAPAQTNAPDFALSGLDGAMVKGTDLWASDPVLLVFMASWCEACRDEVPTLNALAKSHRVIAIASGDSQAAIERTRQETGMSYPVLLDGNGEVARAYRIEASPTCILVDKGGVERYRGRVPPKALE